MVSSGFAAKGTTLLWNNVPVLELTNIGIPIAVADDVDITNHDSAFDTEEFVPGVLRGGDFEVEGNLLPGDTDGQVAVLTDLQSRTARACIIIGPVAKYNFSFTAYCKHFGPTAPVDGKAAIRMSFKVSGKSTMYTTASTGLTTPFLALRDNGANAITPTPTPANTAYHYAAVLDAADTAIAVQPTATAGTIYVNGTVVATGAWSGDIAVAAGTTRQVVIDVREANKASKVYRVFATRPSA
jgi:hypothetical protein